MTVLTPVIRDGINTSYLEITICNLPRKWGSLFAIHNILPTNCRIATVWLQCEAQLAGASAGRASTDHGQLSRILVYKIIICRSILPRTSEQFKIHLEGWRIQIALEAFGLSSYLDSPAFSMNLKLYPQWLGESTDKYWLETNIIKILYLFGPINAHQ